MYVKLKDWMSNSIHMEGKRGAGWGDGRPANYIQSYEELAANCIIMKYGEKFYGRNT